MLTPFLSFKGTTQAYLRKISITHNKNLNPLLNLLINCILAKTELQVLSLNLEKTVLSLKFLIIGLCSFSANSKFCLNLSLTPLPFDVLSKNL